MQSNYSGAPVVEADAATVDALLEGVGKNAQLANKPQIREYLLQFVDLAEVVPHAVEAAKQHFPEAQLVLEVYRDPEIDDEYLALYVRLSRYDDTVMERIAAAEAEYLDRLAGKSGWIQLTTDFRTPDA
jgi:predicted GTPase